MLAVIQRAWLVKYVGKIYGRDLSGLLLQAKHMADIHPTKLDTI